MKKILFFAAVMLLAIPLAFSQDATITTYVWDDQNGDGKQDSGEPAIQGVQVELWKAGTGQLQSDGTDVNGLVTFTIADGTSGLYLKYIKPADHAITLKNVGPNYKDSDADRGNGKTAQFTATGTITNIDCGLWSPGEIKAQVWDDQNGDGKRDSGETLIDGVTVELWQPGHGMLGSAPTVSGVATIPGVPADENVYLKFQKKAANYAYTYKNIGPDYKDSDADRGTGKTHQFKTSKGAETLTDVDCGQWSPGSVKTFVWDDLNGDGKQDGGEPGIDGVKVQLWQPGHGQIGPDYFTSGGGFVTLINVPADENVYLRYHKLNGKHAFTKKDEGPEYKDSDADRGNGKSHQFKTSKGAHLITDVDCGQWSPGFVNTFVWDDLDGDGKQDGGEPGIAGVTVELWQPGSGKLDTKVTDSDGLTTLEGVPADQNVYVKYILPTDHAFTKKDEGPNYKDSDADRGNGKTAQFKTTSGAETITNVDAGMWSPGFVDTFVWDDLNGDGKQDGGEPGIDGVTVELWQPGSGKLDTRVTDSDGKATLEGVPADQNVYVKYILPSGDYAFTLKDTGPNWKDSDADRGSGKTVQFKTTSGAETITTVDAGMWSPGTVKTYVWNDTNGNGKQDDGEYGLPWVKVRVYQPGQGVKAEAFTDIHGIATLPGVPADKNVYLRYYTRSNAYTIAPKDQGPDWKDSDADPGNGKTVQFKTTKGNELVTKWDCGMNVDWNLDTDNDGIPDFMDKYINDATNGGMGTVLAYTWDDQNGNGLQENNEPEMGGVKCKLRKGGSIKGTSYTHPINGLVAFFDIQLGWNVSLDFDKQNSNYAFTHKDAQNNSKDWRDSDVARNNGKTDNFNVPNTNIITDYDAGLWAPGSALAYAWNDLNGNGLQENNEPPVQELTVKLKKGGTTIQTLTTNANGEALFSGNVPADQNVYFDFDRTGMMDFAFTYQNAQNNSKDWRDSDAARNNGKTGTFKTSKGSELLIDNDAGLWAPGSVLTYVWDDQNGNGLWENDEPPVEGLSVELMQGGTTLGTGQSDVNGEVFFDGIVPADQNCYLDFNRTGMLDFAFTWQDAQSNSKDWRDSDAARNNGKTGTFKTKAGSETIDDVWCGLWAPGSITTEVFNDWNGNGLRENDEPGVAGITVKLKQGGTTLASTTSTGSGIVVFNDVIPADQNVYLDFDRPSDHAFTILDAQNNSKDWRDSDAARHNGETDNFKTTKGSEMVVDWDCGVWTPGSVETYVWNDLNGDGLQSDNEPGVEGIRVKLKKGGTTLSTLYTDTDGLAFFDGIVPADQNVYLDFDKTFPGTWDFTIKDALANSKDWKDSDGSTNNGETDLFKSNKGNQTFYDWDCGLVAVDEAPPLTRKDAAIGGSAIDGINVYPNPANQNAEVKIEYTLETSVIVQAVVFNSTGMKVANLTEGLVEEGQQTLTWNTKDLKSGLYMIRMLIGDELHVKNVVVK